VVGVPRLHRHPPRARRSPRRRDDARAPRGLVAGRERGLAAAGADRRGWGAPSSAAA